MPKQTAVEFFMEHAGFSYMPGKETPDEGKRRCAEALATAEAWANEEDVTFTWEVDDIDSSDFDDENEPHALWYCVARIQSEVVASLCGVDFGADKAPWGDPYRRVVEAELAQEAMPG